MRPLPNAEPMVATAKATAPACAYPARVPLARLAAAQAGATVVVAGLLLILPLETSRDLMALALLQGAVAAGLGGAMKMQAWWLPIHALFAPGLVWALRLDFPPMYALGVFLLLASVYAGVPRTRVPLFLTSPAAAKAVARLLPQRRSFAFLDLGCGFGGVLASLARARPGGRYYGIESAPVPFLLSRIRAAIGRGSCSVMWGDFQRLDLSRYEVVYAYLSPAAMPELWRKARREMRPGSLLISNSFDVPGVMPQQTIATGARGGSRLLLWRM